MCYDAASDSYSAYWHEKLPVGYHGTGDIFSSVFVGARMRGKTIEESVRIAADYTVECIRVTNDRKGSNWYGVDFETVIPKLVEKL